MKKLFSIVLAFVLVLSLSAVAEGNIFKVGMEGTFAPYTYHGDDGNLTGFEVDVASAIAEKIGYEVEFVEGAWDSLFPALDGGTIDMIMNQVTITEARQEAYDFSTPYVYTRPVLIVAEGNEEIKTFEDINGKKAAEGLTSNFNQIAQSYGAEIVGQDQFALQMQLILSGEADCCITDELTYGYWLTQIGETGTKIVCYGDDVSSSAAVMCKGRDEFRDAVSNAIDELLADGTIEALSMKYFSMDITKE